MHLDNEKNTTETGRPRIERYTWQLILVLNADEFVFVSEEFVRHYFKQKLSLSTAKDDLLLEEIQSMIILKKKVPAWF